MSGCTSSGSTHGIQGVIRSQGVRLTLYCVHRHLVKQLQRITLYRIPFPAPITD